MTKTKYLLYTFKYQKEKKYSYWYETDKIIISENKHIEYLFFRMLALLNLCAENIHEREGK